MIFSSILVNLKAFIALKTTGSLARRFFKSTFHSVWISVSVKWCSGRFPVLVMTVFSLSSVFSSLVKKEFILNPEEILGLDRGLEAFATGCEVCSGSTTLVWAFISSIFFSWTWVGNFISCFSWRNGANIINFFF